jgi:hypothetical protein
MLAILAESFNVLYPEFKIDDSEIKCWTQDALLALLTKESIYSLMSSRQCYSDIEQYEDGRLFFTMRKQLQKEKQLQPTATFKTPRLTQNTTGTINNSGIKNPVVTRNSCTNTGTCSFDSQERLTMNYITFDFLTNNSMYRIQSNGTNPQLMVLKQTSGFGQSLTEVNVSKAQVITKAIESITFDFGTYPKPKKETIQDEVFKLLCQKQVQHKTYQRLAKYFTAGAVKDDESVKEYNILVLLYVVMVHWTLEQGLEDNFGLLLFHNNSNPMVGATLDAVWRNIQNFDLTKNIKTLYNICKNPPSLLEDDGIKKDMCSRLNASEYFPSEAVHERHVPKQRWSQVLRGMFSK